VTRLVNWDPAGPHYLNVPTSPGACLLEMLDKGFNGSGSFGRKWLRLRRGQVAVQGGGLVSLSQSGQLPGGIGTLAKESQTWASLRTLAFPSFHLNSLLSQRGSLVPFDALYSNHATRMVRTTLSATHTNQLVEFFLRLGGHYIDPAANNGSPSRKLARFQLLGGDENEFVLNGLPGNYPLTPGLLRLATLRSLLDTNAFLQTVSPGIPPPLSQCFRARAYGQTGQLWPPLPNPAPPPQQPRPDNPIVGGSLRAMTWNEDFDLGSGRVPERGFQPRFLGLGGSISTMVAMFPSVGTNVDSHYWCTPGVEVMGDNPARFNPHMNAFATNTLLPTHYDDFLSHIDSTYWYTY
jgi:hypothetical protein